MIHKRERSLHTDTTEHLGVHMMYTLTRGPSKLVTQRRTGPTQQVESKLGDLKLKPTSWLSSNSPPPKIVFNRLNGRRYHGAATQKAPSPAEGFTAAHEENVRFVCEAWQEVEQQLGDGESADSQGPIQYSEKTPSAAMKNFVPIDLEEWWAQRFLANIANLT
ncbi:MAPK regulated corepressor interacting protein 2 [Cebidichthys violaceus]|uniref:MAPK regulated corepressor interacting protein 2 n=1 Tax=Cebidichthys violaceus TaxID=271503 RepID=UPI0035C98405